MHDVNQPADSVNEHVVQPVTVLFLLSSPPPVLIKYAKSGNSVATFSRLINSINMFINLLKVFMNMFNRYFDFLT